MTGKDKAILDAVAAVIKRRMKSSASSRAGGHSDQVLNVDGSQDVSIGPRLHLPAPTIHNEVAVPSVEVVNQVSVPSVTVHVDMAPVANALVALTGIVANLEPPPAPAVVPPDMAPIARAIEPFAAAVDRMTDAFQGMMEMLSQLTQVVQSLADRPVPRPVVKVSVPEPAAFPPLKRKPRKLTIEHSDGTTSTVMEQA